MTIRSALYALLPSLALLGCGDNTDSEARDYPSCEYDFEATIRSGPDAGLAVQGTLRLADLGELRAGAAFGELELSDGSRMMVTAEAGADLDMYFWLPDGNVIHGTGALSGDIGTCPQRIEGSAVGPRAGSTGDWLALGTTNLICTLQCGCPFNEQSATPACQNACFLIGQDPNTATGMQCVATCVQNELNEGCTCESVQQGAGVSQFFPNSACH